MRVAIICEFSGVVRSAFRAEGHDAWSCDLLPTEDGSPHHIQGDALQQDWRGFDLAICHPPCTDIAVSGRAWFKKKGVDRQLAGIQFALKLYALPIPRLAVENPVSLLSRWRKPNQIIQPWQFGHGETKAICLWTRGLPKLEPTFIREDRAERIHHEPPHPDRWKRRSRFYYGVALAMARQWGSLPV